MIHLIHHATYAIAPLAIAAIPELYKMGLGIYQGIKANQLAKKPRPQYEIPGAATEALNLSRMRALDTQLPGQSIMEQRIGGATAGGIGSLKETTGGTAALAAGTAAMVGSQQDALGNLAMKGAENYNQNQANLGNSLNQYAGWQEKQFDWNKVQPYMTAMNAAAAMRGAQQQNIEGGLKGLSGDWLDSKLNKDPMQRQGTLTPMQSQVNMTQTPSQVNLPNQDLIQKYTSLPRNVDNTLDTSSLSYDEREKLRSMGFKIKE